MIININVFPAKYMQNADPSAWHIVNVQKITIIFALSTWVLEVVKYCANVSRWLLVWQLGLQKPLHNPESSEALGLGLTEVLAVMVPQGGSENSLYV